MKPEYKKACENEQDAIEIVQNRIDELLQDNRVQLYLASMRGSGHTAEECRKAITDIAISSLCGNG